MSRAWKDTVSRRPLLMALAAIAGAGVAGVAAYEGAALFGRRYTGPHAELLSALGDSGNAATVGRAVLAGAPAFDPRHMTRQLQDMIGHRDLATVLTREVERGQVMEVRGWVLPEALAWLCALAARPS